MIVSVFVRRLREGCSFADFLREWEADVGFGVPTRVFNAVSLEDSREVISIGFVGVTPAELEEGLAAARDSEQVRHDGIDTVIESTTLRAMYHGRRSTTSPLFRNASIWPPQKACSSHYGEPPLSEGK